jgi:rhamnosyltransferase
MNNGYHIAYTREAEVIHVHNETPSDVFNRYRREAMAMKRIRPHEKFHWWDFFRLFVSNVLSDLWFARKESSLFKEFSGILWFRMMQFWGTYRGFTLAGPLTSQLRRTFYYPRFGGNSSTTDERSNEPIDYGKEIASLERRFKNE